MIYRPATALMEAELDDELVGLDVASGFGYGFDPIGKRIWRLLEQPLSIDEMVGVPVGEYAVEREQCLADVTELLEARRRWALRRDAAN